MIVAEYNKALGSLHEDVWYGLDTEEKLNVLQRIADHECALVLGCDTVEIKAALMSTEGLYGAYNPIVHNITISSEIIEKMDMETVLDTLIHEVRHSWQRQAAEIYFKVSGILSEEELEISFFRDARTYLDEFRDYEFGILDYDAYYEQTVERDSREYASVRVDEILYEAGI